MLELCLKGIALQHVLKLDYVYVRMCWSTCYSIEDDEFSYILVAPSLLVYESLQEEVSTMDTCRRYESCDNHVMIT